jgi:hypothetical protein
MVDELQQREGAVDVASGSGPPQPTARGDTGGNIPAALQQTTEKPIGSW